MSRKPIHPFIHKLAETIRLEYELEAPKWYYSIPDREDVNVLKEECNTNSVHDPNQIRLNAWLGLKGGHNLIAGYQCEFGKIICILEEADQVKEIPFDLWGRIMRCFKGKSKTKDLYRIFFIASTSLREMPDPKETFGPENINGGYSYPCRHDTILVYRAEDATRVLIHELFHASCSDDMSASVDEREAETEAWAEFFYCAFLSRGTPYILRDLVQRQSQYMSIQNKMIADHIGKKGVKEKVFPWRYTIGKQEVWERWGIFDDDSSVGPKIHVGSSMRLTLKPTKYMKAREDVTDDSNIL